MEIISHQTWVSALPVFEFYQAGAARKLPLLILMHGFTGSKHDLIHQAQQYAGESFYAVSVDLHRHGDLGEIPFVPAQVSPYLEDVLDRSADNLDRLITAYAGNPAVDTERVYLLGVSLGGAVIYRYLPRRKAAVRAAACMIAGCDPFWEKTFRSVMRLYPDFGITEEFLAQATATIQTRPFLAGVSDFPLLMQYGKQDPIVPVEEVRQVYAQVRQAYCQPDKIRLMEYEGCGHETPPAMYADALSWFMKW
jgi:dienelactone hydrolase